MHVWGEDKSGYWTFFVSIPELPVKPVYPVWSYWSYSPPIQYSMATGILAHTASIPSISS